MSKEKKTNSELIIDTLRSGKALRSPDITSMVAESSGKDIKIQDVASILAKLSNSSKCDLGYLIKSFEEAGTIKILLNETNIFGNNILNPLSVIVWQPVHATDNDKR